MEIEGEAKQLELKVFKVLGQFGKGWQPKKDFDSPITTLSGFKSHTHFTILPKHTKMLPAASDINYACIPFNPASAGAYLWLPAVL